MKNKRNNSFLLQITLGLAVASGLNLSAQPLAWAQHQHPQTTASTTSDAWAEAEVRKVDVEARKVTLKHGEIKSLDMPAMTMVFQVDDPNLLKGLNTGERISFKAAHEQGRYVLTSWQKKQ
jgi:Cu/Ag efflux protein CusF